MTTNNVYLETSEQGYCNCTDCFLFIGGEKALNYSTQFITVVRQLCQESVLKYFSLYRSFTVITFTSEKRIVTFVY